MTREIIFSVRGNQKDPKSGNPIPYKRTLAGKFRKDSTEYFDWKEYVRAEIGRNAHIRFFDEENQWQPFSPETHIEGGHYWPRIAEKGERIRVDCDIEYADERRGDGDNILKGILDALFYNDKAVYAGSYECRLSPNKRGRVGITITIESDPE